MKIKFITLTVLIMISLILTASANDDLMFAVGLYEDGNYSLAQQELVKYLAEYPQSEYRPEASYLLADIYLEQKNYQQANEIFGELSKTPPATMPYSDILSGLGQSYYYLQNYSEAIKVFTQLITSYPQNEQISRFYYFLGASMIETGDFEKAEENLLRAMSIEDRMSVRLKLIQLYLSEKELVKAEELILTSLEKYAGNENLNYALVLFHNENIKRNEYEKVLNIGYDSINSTSEYYSQYQMLLGIAEFELGNYSQAAEHLAVLTSDQARYYFALCQIKLKNTIEAKAILQNLKNSDNEELIANSQFYLADLAENPTQKESLLKQFIGEYPDNVFIAETLYQLGITQFLLNKYNYAAENLQKSLASGLTSVYQEKAWYIKAEAEYLSGNHETALTDFSAYLEKYPNGQFADEAYFRKGLCYFNKSEMSNAQEQFELVVYNFENSDKQGMSNFYLGEIALLNKNFEISRKHYTIALNQRADHNLVWLRIAQSWQQNKNYSKASAALNNVDDSSQYMIQKQVLLGDIYFAQKEYSNALKSYQQAEDLEIDNTKKENIMAKEAWTYYQKGEYDKASDIYNQLSIRTDNPASYTFQSATALFSAQQYDSALKQYRIFVKNFPESSNALSAMLGIGDCLYNLGQFDAARKQYRSLITKVTDPDLHQNILDGWKWSTEQAGENFLDEINDYLNNEDIPVNFRFLVDECKAKHLFAIHEYQQVSDLVDRMKRTYIYPMKDLEYLKARSYKNMEMWDAADDFYARLFIVYKDPQLQYEWADITLVQGRIETTVRKLQYAAEKLKKPEFILRLLQIEAKYDRSEFEQDYPLYIDLLSGIDLEKAQLENCRWLLNQQKIAEAAPIIAGLKESSTEEIKASAQYLSGFSLYQQQKYQEAIPELLRVRHLFPYLTDIRHQSEVLAFRAYLKLDKKQDAENLLGNIRDDLDPEQANELENLLKGK